MRGPGAQKTVADDVTSSGKSVADTEQGKPRKANRGFFVALADSIVREMENVTWSIPPVYPFDGQDRMDNSGFLF